MTCQPISMNSVTNLRAALKRSSRAGLDEGDDQRPALQRLLPLEADFPSLAHRHQEPPSFANGGRPWTTWLMLGGRGAGKTRLGAEWVRASVHGTRPYADQCCLNDRAGRRDRARRARGDDRGRRPAFSRAPRARAPAMDAVAPPAGMAERRRRRRRFRRKIRSSLRGPQFDAAWCDELAKWRHAEATFDMLQFGLRLGVRPRQLITTTPRPIALIKRLLADPRTAVTRGGDARQCRASGAGVSRRGAGALRRHAARPAGARRRDHRGPRRCAVDARRSSRRCACQGAAAVAHRGRRSIRRRSARPGADACGIVAAGSPRTARSTCWRTPRFSGLAPHGWAAPCVALWRRLRPTLVVAEVNQGGDMVRAVMQQVDPAVPVRTVRATRGKWLRAEPVAMRLRAGPGEARAAASGAGGSRCATSASTDFHRAARPTGSTRWSGRSPTS